MVKIDKVGTTIYHKVFWEFFIKKNHELLLLYLV
jgi:hypothetical protein